MPLILGTNSIKDTGYKVANSLRFNEGSSDTLTRTPSSAGNRRTWTYSAWHKVEAYNSNKAGRFLVAQTDGSNLVDFAYGNNGEIYLGIYEGGVWKETVTNAYHRDVSAWYHLVVAVDTTQATDSNRVKLYVNGVHQTSLSTSNYPSQNYETSINNTVSHIIGSYTGNSIYYNGYMAEVVLIDGTALDPTSFGEFDSDSPNIWKPIDVSGLTFGTNGFYLDFENASSLGADVSGNSNNFTVNNLTSVDQSTDTCTNNFATLNPLNGNHYAGLTFSEGNLKITTTAANYAPGQSTIGFNKGKWYAEFKATDADNWTIAGIVSYNASGSNDYVGKYPGSYGYVGGSSAGGSYSKVTSAVFSSYGATYGDGDIISVAVDADNNKIYFAKNGTYIDSGDPTSGSTGTGAAFTISSPPPNGFYFFAVGNYSGSQTPDWEANFGSPPYSVSSGNSDANGFGNFSYSVPSGYFSLCSSNLAEFG